MAMAVVAVMAMPVATMAVAAVTAMATVSAGHRRAVDRQRGGAQCENRDRRHNEFLDAGHDILQFFAARVSPAVIEGVNQLEITRCDSGHTGSLTRRREVGYCFTADGRDILREIVEMGAALACPRYDTRYMRFEQAAALAAQPRSSYCVKRH